MRRTKPYKMIKVLGIPFAVVEAFYEHETLGSHLEPEFCLEAVSAGVVLASGVSLSSLEQAEKNLRRNLAKRIEYWRKWHAHTSYDPLNKVWRRIVDNE